jgi:hypothetical protein
MASLFFFDPSPASLEATLLCCKAERLFILYKIRIRLGKTQDHPVPSSSEGKESSLQHFLHFLIIFLPLVLLSVHPVPFCSSSLLAPGAVSVYLSTMFTSSLRPYSSLSFSSRHNMCLIPRAALLLMLYGALSSYGA